MSAKRNIHLARRAYFLAVMEALDDKRISPGFARVTAEDKGGFTISLTIPNRLVEKLAKDQPEWLEKAADATDLESGSSD